jgi:hypothetical protein
VLAQVLAGRFAAQRAREGLDHLGPRVVAQIDPGVVLQKTQRRVRSVQENGDDGEPVVPVLPLERVPLFSLLSPAHAVRAEEDGDRLALAQSRLEHLNPGSSRPQVPTIEER